MIDVPVEALPLARFLPVLGARNMDAANQMVDWVRARFAGRTIWNVNSTPAGGGVAEMLRSLLAYARGAGIDTRWVVIEGSAEFFRLTKRLHHALHGSRGDGSPLEDEARAIYEKTLHKNADDITSMVRPGDVVLLHDPQTVGLADILAAHGAIVVWRCHIGHDEGGGEVDRGWAFLEPFVKRAHAFVFSRRAFVPAFCPPEQTVIITPSIDAFSAKNQEMTEETVRAILVRTGLIEGPPGEGLPLFVREDGSPGRVDRRAEVIHSGRPPRWDTPLVVQVSRWDPLKDPLGVLRGFADLVSQGGAGAYELGLGGPDVTAVADDPEGAAVYGQVLQEWRALADGIRSRVHLASLPMDDVQENAAIVNAIQRHASIVVQKSLHEGFGLTVTEAMWKARPVIASAVGGIQDQIVDGVHGLLLSDPTDRAAYVVALNRLIDDPVFAAELGSNARERVRERFLGLHHLIKYGELILRLDEEHVVAGRPAVFRS